MEERLIETKTLANGLEMSIYDASRKIAGDRWYVVLLARVVVPVREGFLGQGADAMDPADVQKALGETVVFEQRRERNFVDDNDKTAVFDNLYQTFLSGTGAYVAHPDFPIRFIKKRLSECLAG